MAHSTEQGIVITIPDVGLTEQELRQELAIALFQQNRATLAKAADIAGITRLDFQRLLAERAIPLHYGLDDLAADMAGLRDQYGDSDRRAPDHSSRSLPLDQQVYHQAAR